MRPTNALARAADPLVANVAVTSVLGFVFWIAAARLVPAEQLGRDAALLSALLTVSAMSQLNLTTALLRFLPVTRTRVARVVIAAYAVTGGVAVIAATLFVLSAPRLSARFGFLHQDPWLAVAFVAAAVAWGVFTLQDAVLTALGRSGWVPLENAVFGVVKIALLPLLATLSGGHVVFVAWIAATAMLVVPVNVLTFRRALRARPEVSGPAPLERFGRRRLVRFSLGDLGGTFFGHAASTMLPVVVAGLLGGAESAYFFIPFTIVAAFDLVFLNVASALTVQGAAGEARLTEHLQAVARRYAPLLAAGVAVGIAGAPLLLGLYGGGYAEHSSVVLRLLLCASLFRALVALHVAVCRVHGDGGSILGTQAATCVLVLGLTAALAPALGLAGVAAAWLIANALVALRAAPRLLDLYRVPACATSA